MSTMQPTSGHSQACCNVPPATVKDYKPKGRYIDLDGMQCYTTGPSTATSAIFIIYDIFGFSPQILQGADILAHADAKTGHEYQVYMPDFFLGKPYSPSDFPPDTEEKQKKLGAFFSGPANPPSTASKIPSLISQITSLSPNIQKWGSLGMCWGGKIVSLTAQAKSNTPFSAAAEVHPAMVDPEDAKGIEIPVCMLASGDEDGEAVKKFAESLGKGGEQNHFETFGDQVHGWMAARGELEKDSVRKEFERGYQTLLDFYHKTL